MKITLFSLTFEEKLMKMETGKVIREFRIKKGMTQEELANKTEVSARTIQRIENGEVDPQAYTLQMIAKALDVDYSMFAENESDAILSNHLSRILHEDKELLERLAK